MGSKNALQSYFHAPMGFTENLLPILGTHEMPIQIKIRRFKIDV